MCGRVCSRGPANSVSSDNGASVEYTAHAHLKEQLDHRREYAAMAGECSTFVCVALLTCGFFVRAVFEGTW